MLFATSRSLLRTLERERAAFQQERAQLIETICLLAGRQQAPTATDLWRQQQDDARRAEQRRREAESDDLIDPSELPDHELADLTR